MKIFRKSQEKIAGTGTSIHGLERLQQGARSYRSRIINSVRLSIVVLALASDRRSSGQGLFSAQAGSSQHIALLKRPVEAA